MIRTPLTSLQGKEMDEAIRGRADGCSRVYWDDGWWTIGVV